MPYPHVPSTLIQFEGAGFENLMTQGCQGVDCPSQSVIVVPLLIIEIIKALSFFFSVFSLILWVIYVFLHERGCTIHDENGKFLHIFLLPLLFTPSKPMFRISIMQIDIVVLRALMVKVNYFDQLAQ